MYVLRKSFRFEASHQLVNHDGKCARLHGHSWVATIEVVGPDVQGATTEAGAVNPKENMLYDYSDISQVVKPIVEAKLDHWHLNDTLECSMPTSEFVASWLYQQLVEQVKGLKAIEIEETCTSRCRYEV